MPGIPSKSECTVPTQPAESDTEARPEMEIPSILDKNDLEQKHEIAQDLSRKFANGVQRARSPNNENYDEDGYNSSDSEASVVMGEYVPPPTKQCASGPTDGITNRCGSFYMSLCASCFAAPLVAVRLNYKFVTKSYVFTDHFNQSNFHFVTIQMFLFISDILFLCLIFPKYNLSICIVHF